MMSLTVRQTAVIVLVFVLVSGGLIALDQRHKLATLRESADPIVAPLALSLQRAGNWVAGRDGSDDSDLARQLAAVTAERDRLLAENARLKALEQEVAGLREQLGFRQAHPELNLIGANVVGRDPDGLRQFVTLDRGANDGIRVGMAVVSPNFFVGQVTDVAPDSARVTLAIDASYQVAAMLQDSRADGIVFGRWQRGTRLVMRYLDPKTEVADGALVVTSGKTTGVPEGLVIGKVAGVHRDAQADRLTLDVAPLADYANLQTVMVVVGGGEQR